MILILEPPEAGVQLLGSIIEGFVSTLCVWGRNIKVSNEKSLLIENGLTLRVHYNDQQGSQRFRWDVKTEKRYNRFVSSGGV